MVKQHDLGPHDLQAGHVAGKAGQACQFEEGSREGLHMPKCGIPSPGGAVRGLHQVRGVGLHALPEHYMAAERMLVCRQHAQELEACAQIIHPSVAVAWLVSAHAWEIDCEHPKQDNFSNRLSSSRCSWDVRSMAPIDCFAQHIWLAGYGWLKGSTLLTSAIPVGEATWFK